jgi:N-acyl-D-amino-acid deacylase
VEPAVGVNWVLVNGVPVIDDGNPTGQLPGRVVRHEYRA